MLKANNATPLYKQLKIALKNDILNHVYNQGERIPSESELGEQYGVSRITVRYALQELEKEGMLERRQGKGTFVSHRKIQSNMSTIQGFTDVLSQMGQAPQRFIHSKAIIHAEEWVANYLQIPVFSPVIELKRTMGTSIESVLYDDSYYPAERFPGMLEKIEESTSTYALMKEAYGVRLSRAHKRFNVEIADVPMSQLLGCSPGEPLFSNTKIAFDSDDIPVHLSKTLVLANNVTYVLEVDEVTKSDITLEMRSGDAVVKY